MTGPVLSRSLSCEDLDLVNLSPDDFDRLSAAALRAAQSTHLQDAPIYRHGCCAVEPGHEELLPLIRSGAI